MSFLQHQFPVLIGDIGGTNARFQILRDRDAAIETFDIVQTADFDNVEMAITETVLSKTDTRPKTIILAAAGPITGDGLDLTNSAWNIEPRKIFDLGSFERIVLLNDFEAQGLSLPFLTDGDLCQLGDGDTETNRNDTKIVLGPGTGLGVGGIIKAGGIWIPLCGEGGHMDLGPRTAREAVVWQHLEKAEGRVSAEQVLSGQGLINAYRAICRSDGLEEKLTSPSSISAAALEAQDRQAVEALTLFCTCLGRVAGDLAAIVMAKGGVYIAGGIGKKIHPFLEKSPFRAAFEDKAPHSELMRQIPTYLVTHELPALVGLAAYARQPELFGVDISQRVWSGNKSGQGLRNSL